MRHLFRNLALALIPIVAAGRLAAQEPPDSLAERVRRAEQAIERLQAQLAEQSQSAVRSRSRNRVELSGLILLNGFYNSGKTNNNDIPQFADTLVPADTLGLPNANAGGTARQTRLGLTVGDVHALGAVVTGTLQVDFLGGQQASVGGRTFPLARIRTASLRLDWAHVGLLLGQDALVIAPQNPVSFAGFATPLFTSAGNLWFRVPQVRLTTETPGSAHFGVQAAALAPMLPKAQGVFLTQPDSAERSQRPSVEGRVYLAWGSDETSSEVGFGAHLGWIATNGDTLLQSHAIAGDVRLAIGTHLTLAGEVYTGQAVAGFGGGAIGQEFGIGNVPVRATGGWAQLDIRPSRSCEFGGGYGMDRPNASDLPAGARLRNVVYAGHLIWRPGGGLMFGTEWRRAETTYDRGTLAVNHVNAYAGLAF